jgi:hypothetical protein
MLFFPQVQNISTASNIFRTNVIGLEQALRIYMGRSLHVPVKRHPLLQHAPDEFKHVKFFLDSTDHPIEKFRGNVVLESASRSPHKSTYTGKRLVLLGEDLRTIWSSPVFLGNCSDPDLCDASGLYDFLEKYMSLQPAGTEVDIILDKGFRIENKLMDIDIGMLIPDFVAAKYLSKYAVKNSKKIAKLRVEIERTIEKEKRFKILHNLHYFLNPLADSITYVVAILASHFNPCQINKNRYAEDEE